MIKAEGRLKMVEAVLQLPCVRVKTDPRDVCETTRIICEDLMLYVGSLVDQTGRKKGQGPRSGEKKKPKVSSEAEALLGGE